MLIFCLANLVSYQNISGNAIPSRVNYFGNALKIMQLFLPYNIASSLANHKAAFMGLCVAQTRGISRCVNSDSTNIM